MQDNILILAITLYRTQLLVNVSGMTGRSAGKIGKPIQFYPSMSFHREKCKLISPLIGLNYKSTLPYPSQYSILLVKKLPPHPICTQFEHHFHVPIRFAVPCIQKCLRQVETISLPAKPTARA